MLRRHQWHRPGDQTLRRSSMLVVKMVFSISQISQEGFAVDILSDDKLKVLILSKDRRGPCLCPRRWATTLC